MSKKEGSRTQAIEVKFQPERPYNLIDVFVSYGKWLNLFGDSDLSRVNLKMAKILLYFRPGI